MYIKENFPRNLKEFIGNEEIRILLDVLISNKLTYNRIIPHILFYGRAGLGKTTLAEILASETKASFQSFIGNQLTEERIFDVLYRISSSDILFIDEIHGLDNKVEEILYSVLQNFKYKKEDIGFILPQFTVIGATTEKSGLNKPLIDRFIYQLNLHNYSIEEINKIAILYSKEYGEKQGIEINNDSLNIISKISQGVPRLLKNIYLICLDFSIKKNVKVITKEIVKKVMSLLHINKDGLDYLQQKYLYYLKEINRPVGLNALSSYLGVTEKDISYLVEPFILENGFITREPKGRLITEKGKNQ